MKFVYVGILVPGRGIKGIGTARCRGRSGSGCAGGEGTSACERADDDRRIVKLVAVSLVEFDFRPYIARSGSVAAYSG